MLYSVAELVLGFKTAGILHQPFPPAKSLGPITPAEPQESSTLLLALVIARNFPCILLGLLFKMRLLTMDKMMVHIKLLASQPKSPAPSSFLDNILLEW
jgi:hypothetical protein